MQRDLAEFGVENLLILSDSETSSDSSLKKFRAQPPCHHGLKNCKYEIEYAYKLRNN